MAVDRGSLRYTIALESAEAVEGLGAFRGELVKTRKSWRAFRQDIKAVSKDSQGIAANLKNLAAQTTKAAVAAEKSAVAVKKSAEQSKKDAAAKNEEAKATEKVLSSTKSLTFEQKELRKIQGQLSRERKINQSKNIRSLRETLSIVKQVAKAEDKLSRLQRLAKQGRDIRTGELSAARAKRQILEAQNDLEREQSTLDNEQLLSTRAQLAVTQRLVKLEQQRIQAKLLGDRGRLASGLTIEETGLAKFNKELEGLKIDKVRKRLQEANPEFRKLKDELRGVSSAAVKARPRFSALRGALSKTRENANRLSFTFRRLIGIFAAFAAVRTVVRLFNDMVSGAINFNAAIQQSVLGIASLFTAVGAVRNAVGEAVGATEQLALAQVEARRQIGLLRKDALQTVATFRELRETFQIALAPGVDAGLGIDEIRNFTIQISQAAAAIGLQQNQLAEEIRSILAGTIQLRTTRIAAALGITNEDIRAAKELGVLAEFLNERFNAFTTAGAEAMELFTAVLSNVRDASEELLRQGSLEFFEEVSGLLKDVLGTLTEVNEEGVVVNPEAISVVSALFKGLQQAVAEARRLGSQLSANTLLSGAEAVGNAIGTSAKIIGGIIEGFIKGAKDIVRLLEPVTDILGSLLPGKELSEQVASATRLLTVVLGLGVAWKVVLSLTGLVLAPIAKIIGLIQSGVLALGGWSGALAKIKGSLSSISILLTRALSPVLLIAAVLGTILFQAISLGAEVLGIQLKFETVARIVRTVLSAAFRVSAAKAKLAYTGLFTFLKNGFSIIIRTFQEGIFAALFVGLKTAEFFGRDVRKELARLNKARARVQEGFSSSVAEERKKLEAAAKEVADAYAAIPKLASKIDVIIEGNGDALSFDEFLKKTKDDFKSALDGLFDVDNVQDFGLSIEEASQQSENLADSLSQIPGILSRGNRAVKGLEKTLRDLSEELKDASDELASAANIKGVSGVTSDVASGLADRSVRLRKEELTIATEIKNTELARNRATAKGLSLQTEIQSRYGDQAKDVEDLLNFSKLLVGTQSDIAAGQAKLTSLVGIREALKSQNRQEEAGALDDEIRTQRAKIKDLIEFAAFGKDLTTELISNLGGVADDKLIGIIKDTLLARGQEVVLQQDLNALIEQRSELEDAINAVAIKRIETVSVRQKEQAENRLVLLSAELEAAKTLAAFSTGLRVEGPGFELAQAETSLDIEKARLSLLKDQRIEQQRLGRENLITLASIGADEEALLLVKEAQVAAQRILNTEIGKQEIEVEKAAAAARREKKKLEEPVSFGLVDGLDDFVESSMEQFERWKDIGESAARELSDTISTLITDAFDPRKDISIEEAFGELALSIANQIFSNLSDQLIAFLIETLQNSELAKLFGSGTGAAADAATDAAVGAGTEAAVGAGTEAAVGAASTLALEAAAISIGTAATGMATSIAAASTASAGSIGTASGLLGTASGSLSVSSGLLDLSAGLLDGAAAALTTAALASSLGGVTGGLITRGGASSPSHSLPGVQGLASGGRIRGYKKPRSRPSTVDPRDTVPIWAQPGEFMMRLRAVRLYGSKVMQDINNGILDPASLQALTGASNGVARAHQGPGFAEGGLISDKIDTGNNLARKASESVEDRGLFQRALLVPDEETMDRLLAQGSDAQQRWLQENSSEALASLTNF